MQPDADKSKSRSKSLDMSPEAMLRRLQICGDLSDACRELTKHVKIDSRKNDDTTCCADNSKRDPT